MTEEWIDIGKIFKEGESKPKDHNAPHNGNYEWFEQTDPVLPKIELTRFTVVFPQEENLARPNDRTCSVGRAGGRSVVRYH